MNKKLQFFVILSTDGVARSLSVQPRASGRRRETSRAAVDHRLSKLQSHSGPQEWVLAGCFIANRCVSLITYCTPLLLYIYVPWLTDLLNLLHFTLQHTHTHPFNCRFSGTTRVSRYQKGKTNLDFAVARDNEWQWHQLGYMPFLPPNQQCQSTEGQTEHWRYFATHMECILIAQCTCTGHVSISVTNLCLLKIAKLDEAGFWHRRYHQLTLHCLVINLDICKNRGTLLWVLVKNSKQFLTSTFASV